MKINTIVTVVEDHFYNENNGAKAQESFDNFNVLFERKTQTTLPTFAKRKFVVSGATMTPTSEGVLVQVTYQSVNV